MRPIAEQRRQADAQHRAIEPGGPMHAGAGCCFGQGFHFIRLKNNWLFAVPLLTTLGYRNGGSRAASATVAAENVSDSPFGEVAVAGMINDLPAGMLALGIGSIVGAPKMENGTADKQATLQQKQR